MPQAIAEAKGHLEDGHGWVVDLDLEKFFDLVCHQRLTAKLAKRVSDRRLLVLIGRMLRAKVVLPDGVVINSEQGVPQGVRAMLRIMPIPNLRPRGIAARASGGIGWMPASHPSG